MRGVGGRVFRSGFNGFNAHFQGFQGFFSNNLRCVPVFAGFDITVVLAALEMATESLVRTCIQTTASADIMLSCSRGIRRSITSSEAYIIKRSLFCRALRTPVSR